MAIRDTPAVLRRILVLTMYVLQGFHADNGSPRDVNANRARLRRFDLLDELEPEEHAFLLGDGDVTQRQIIDATWRAEALVALRWAIGDQDDLPVGGQVSLLRSIPDLGDDDEIRARLAGDRPIPLRTERELRRALERWFAVYWRMRLRIVGVERLHLARWVDDNPALTVLTPADLPLVDGDLSLDADVMAVARDDPAARTGGWQIVLPDGASGQVEGADGQVEPEDDWPVEDGRVPIQVCTAGMLEAGENVLRVTVERLRALRWLLGGTDRLGQEPPGHYEPDSPAGYDKTVLYRDDRYAARGGLPWCRAAWLGDVPQLRSLIGPGDGAKTMIADVDGDLAIHCAVLGGQRAALDLLLAADAPIGHTLEDDAGRTALDLAAARGDVELIDTIVGTLAPGDGWLRHSTALVEAVRAGQPAAVAHLIRLGVALDGALAAAITADRSDLVRQLVEAGAAADGHALYQALGERRFASAGALIDLGADPRFADGSGTTVLHLAADRGATRLCLRLLDAGTDPDVRLEGFGAVHFAMLGGHTETALALIERGADVTGTDRPLISIALDGGSATLVRWCLDRGEVPEPDAVQAAVLADRAEVLHVLVDGGLPVDAANSAGVTPLHLAADRGHAACVEVLLAAGASVDPVVPGQNRTALDLARLHGHEECVRLLAAV